MRITLDQAMKVLGLAEVTSLQQVKKSYKSACIKAHPDKMGGSQELMKMVNGSYELLKAIYTNNPTFTYKCNGNYGSAGSAGSHGSAGSSEGTQGGNKERKSFFDDFEKNEYFIKVYEAIGKIIDLGDLEIEIAGIYVWISGDTKKHKNALKAAGFKWHSMRKVWFMKPEGYKTRSSDLSFDEIKEKYHAQKVTKRSAEKRQFKSINS